MSRLDAAKLTEEQRARLRALMGDLGRKRAARALHSSEGMVDTLASGGSATAKGVAHVVAQLDAIATKGAA